MKYVPTAITRMVGRTVLRTKYHSPAILFGTGIVGMGATIFLAAKATLHVEDVLVDHEKDLLDLQHVQSNNPEAGRVHYENQKRHIVIRTSIRLVKLYAPTAVAGVVTIACLTSSHRQLTNRNAQLTAAYVGLQRFLESYRGRVQQEIGKEKERDVYYASTPVELARDTDEGTVTYYGSKPGKMGPYSCIFDERNQNFQESGTYNEHYIRIQEGLLTDKLRAQGHLFLNEVYDRLGCPRTQTGQQAGWAVRHPQSDDFVEIRIVPMHDYHGSLMLDFNVAGSVMDMAFGHGIEG